MTGVQLVCNALVVQVLQTDCSEIILSKLDLDNTSERTCVALIPDLLAIPCRGEQLTWSCVG
jgi:hypothetical protein